MTIELRVPSTQRVLSFGDGWRTLLSRQISFFILLSTIFLLPIFKAGMMPGALSLFIVSIIFCFILAILKLPAIDMKPWLLVWLIFSTAVFLHIFVLPKINNVWNWLPLSLSNETGLQSYPTAISPLRSFSVWAYFSAMWFVAWRTSWLDMAQLSKVLWVVFACSFFQATYGLWHLLSGAESVLGLWIKVYGTSHATGTFVNRNHFAGMLSICWPLVLAALLSSKPLLFAKFPITIRALIVVFYSFILLLALVSSNSRMGVIAGFLGFIVWGVLSIRNSIGKTRPFLRRILPWTAISLSLTIVIWFGINDLIERYLRLENGDARTHVWGAMFDLPITVWFIGTGPGTFEDVFGVIKPSSISSRFVYAHNDYLEFAFEFGLLFTLIIIGALTYWFRSVFLFKYQEIHAGVWGTLAAVSFHSLADFNLQIPGSAIFFWVAVGLIMNPNMIEQRDASDVQEISTRGLQGHTSVKQRKPNKNSRVLKTRKEWFAFFRSS